MFKRVSLFLFLFLTAHTTIGNRALGDDLFLRGDANVDSDVDISDAVATFSYLFLANEILPCLDAADSNDDGAVDISDGIATLSFLFQGDDMPPPPGPGPCPGEDPTDDALGCVSGVIEALHPPEILFWPEAAPPSGIRQRRGFLLPFDGERYSVPEGISFAIVVEAKSSAVSQAGISLADPLNPGAGNPEALQVSSDRDLGDPAQGGIPAGDNLASLFLRDVDLWSDPIFLIQRAVVRIDGGSVIAPAPGSYRFKATVTDKTCAQSTEASFVLDVFPSREPEVHLWLEGEGDGSPDGEPRPASAATGGLVLGAAERAYLVVQASPNGKVGTSAGVDTESFQLLADPPLFSGTAPSDDVSSRFTFEGIAPGGAARWYVLLNESAGGDSLQGNYRLTGTVSEAEGEDKGGSNAILEGEVSYSEDIQPIWCGECTGCHEEPAPFKGLELVAPGQPASKIHDNIVYVFASEPDIESSAALLIWPYFPQRSYLLHKLKGTHLDPTVLGSGQRMPLGGPPYLPDTTIRLIEDWIAQGARDN